MSIHLIVGPAGSGKSHALYKKILEISSFDINTDNGTMQHVIVVTPEQFSLTTEQELVRLSDGNGIMNIEVLSFTRLAYRIMDEAGDEGYPVLNDMGKTMIIRKVMQEIKDELRLYAGKEKKAGFLDEIKSIISELSQYMVSPEQLLAAVSGKGNTLFSMKMRELATIYSAFNEKLKGVFTTSENLMQLSFPHIQGSQLLQNAILVFDGFTGFTPIQFKFLENLLSVSGDVYLALAGDDTTVCKVDDGTPIRVGSSEDPGIFSMTAVCIEKLVRLAEKNGIGIDLIDYNKYNYHSDELMVLRDNVFRTRRSPLIHNRSGAIRFAAYRTSKEEAEAIAAAISDLLRNKKYKYSDIAVISGDINTYLPHFRKSFKDYDIKYYTDDSRSIEHNLLVQFILQAFKVIQYGYKAEDVIAFAKSPLAAYDRQAVCQFENYLSCYGYRGQKAFERKWTAQGRIGVQIDLDAINELRGDIIKSLSSLSVVKDNAKAKEYIECVLKLIDDFNLSDKLLSLAQEIAESDIPDREGLAKEYSKVLEAVYSILNQISDICGEDECTSLEFIDIFMTGIGKTKLGTLPPGPDVVTLGDVWRTRLKDIKVLFLAGMNEDVLPRPLGKGGIFTENERQLLMEEQIELAISPKADPLREEFYVYLTLAKPAEGLYLSYSLTRDDREARSSYMYNDIVGLIDNSEYDASEGASSQSSDFDKASNQSDDVNKSIFSDKSLSLLLGFDRGVSLAISDSGDKNPELDEALNSWLTEEDNETYEKIKDIKEGLYSLALVNRLTPQTADRLYDHIIRSSVSKLEMFSECPFKYFMQYGLKIDRQYDNTPERFDYGNVFHDAIKRFFVTLNEKGVDYNSLAPTEFEPIAIDSLHEAIKEYSEGLYMSDERISNYAYRMEAVMLTSVDAFIKHIKAGDYRPWKFETAFEKSGINMQLTGKIDRIDIAKKDGKTYVKIIDYKTGSSKPDYAKLYYGLSLQLPLYMSQLLTNDELGNTLPGATLYQNITDPLVETMDEEKVSSEKLKGLRPVGIISDSIDCIGLIDKDMITVDGRGLKSGYKSEVSFVSTKNDGTFIGNTNGNKTLSVEDFNKLCSFADTKARELTKEILKGEASVSPYKMDSDNGCEYCNYRSICGFDEKISCFKYRRLNLSNDEAIEKILNAAENVDIKENSNDTGKYETAVLPEAIESYDSLEGSKADKAVAKSKRGGEE